MTVVTQLELIKPTDLPAPPQAALQIIRACAREEVTSSEISDIAETNPALTAELLRVANSPLYGISREVTSISNAVAVLGLRALRNLVLCISIHDAINKEAIPNFDAEVFWEDSLRRAIVARQLAPLVKQDPDECFTAGLLQDFGLLILFYLHPEQTNEWQTLRSLSPAERLQQEQTIFSVTHTEIGKKLAEFWELPESLGVAIGAHHTHIYTNDEHSGLPAILQAADWINSVFVTNNPSQALTNATSRATQVLGIDEQAIKDICEALPALVTDAAISLGLKVDKQVEFEQVMRDANVRLAEENTSYQELTWTLEKTLRERDELAAALNNELELAREIQASLLPLDDADTPVHGVNISAKELSGDFYDFFKLDDGRVMFNLGDVSGKGMHAALLMAKTSSLFRCLGKKNHSPAELLKTINREICETSIRGMFVTMVAGIYNPADGSVVLVNAGNPPPILFNPKVKEKKIQLLAADTPPLGIVPDMEYAEVSVNLQQGHLYIYSDGITEGYAPDDGELGVMGLVSLIASLDNMPVQKRLDTIIQHLSQSSKGQRDDMTLLILE
ncbi:Serine phosphatase RsbU, regulator of sigma subunit [hydrothermal vent metagenome]|uniref:Serine phosphatase RsbU, regulator of sigma subunit n=1 Tax=hydrothermal vent metagenome TaxID=652676 RepID=A0A3B1ABV4_9ZZZZ